MTLEQLKKRIADGTIGKQERTKQYLLMGYGVTGNIFGKILKIENYRDCIYHLRKKGLGICHIREKHRDGYHHRWFMTDKAIEEYYQNKREVA